MVIYEYLLGNSSPNVPQNTVSCFEAFIILGLKLLVCDAFFFLNIYMYVYKDATYIYKSNLHV